MKKFNINLYFGLGQNNSMNGINNRELYYESSKELINLLPNTDGILTKRPNTNYISSITIDDKSNINNLKYKLVPLYYNSDSYILEFSNYKIRFYKNNKLLKNNDNSVYELQSFYSKEDLDNLSYTEDFNANALYLFCKGHKPYILSISDLGFSIDEFISNDGPYDDINTSNITFTPNSTGGDNVTIASSDNIFTSEDVGRHIRLFIDNEWGWGIINKFIDQKTISIIVKKYFKKIDTTRFWRLGSWSDNLGYPSLGSIFNSRLYLANTTSKSNCVWVSCFNDYNNFAPTESSDNYGLFKDDEGEVISYVNSISVCVSKSKIINWIFSSTEYVIIGSEEGIFVIMPLNISKPFSPYNYMVKQLNDYNSSNLIVGNSSLIVYSSLDKKKLNILDFYNNSINFFEISLDDYCVSENEIYDFTISGSNNNIIIILFKNGNLIFIFKSLGKEIFYGKSNINLGGLNPIVKAMVSNIYGVYFIVYRSNEVDSYMTTEYIKWDDFFKLDNKETNITYLDCTQSLSFEDKTKFVTCSDFLGEVFVFADSIYIGRIVVNQGMCELPTEANEVIIGYNYTALYESPNIINVNDIYTASGNKKINKITLGFINTVGCKIYDEYNNSIILDVSTDDFVNLNNFFFSGYKTIITNFAWQKEPSFCIAQNEPFPININFLGIELFTT